MPKVGADHSTHTQSMPTNPCSSKIAYLIKFCQLARTTPRSMKRIISTFHNVALPAGWQSHFHHSDASLVRSIETPNWAISMSLKAKENRLDNFSAGSIFVVDFSMFQRAPLWQLSRWNCVITKRKLTPPAPKSMRAICRWHERKFSNSNSAFIDFSNRSLHANGLLLKLKQLKKCGLAKAIAANRKVHSWTAACMTSWWSDSIERVFA